MNGQGLDPSPIARMLLSLAERGVEGSIVVGGRRVRLKGATVVAVDPAPGDEDLGAFLIHAARASADDVHSAHHAAEAEHVSLETALVGRGVLTEDGLAEARRALYLDRLVKGLAEVEDQRDTTHVEVEEGPVGDARGASIRLVPFVLDALTRRAGLSGAELVGARALHTFAWNGAAHEAAARKWSQLPESGAPIRVGQLLAKLPAAAPRIAALARAGVARIYDPDAKPEDLAPSRESLAGKTLPPPRLPVARLAPGEARYSVLPAGHVEVEALPAARTELDDPITPLEARLAELEDEDAPRAERARIHREIARVWQSEWKSLDEAARAYRQAAAVDPEDLAALEQSAVLCAATGQLELSIAYDRAIVRISSGRRRRDALFRRARNALRREDVATAIDSLEQAAREAEDGPDALERLSEVRRLTGDTARAVKDAERAARGLSDAHPSRARALLAWAHAMRPHDPLLVSEYATVLAQDGYHEASIAVLADEADAAEDPDLARSLRLEAAERAERAHRPDLARQYLAVVFDASPDVRSVHDALVKAATAAGGRVSRAVTLEAIATRCAAEERAGFLVQAASAHREIGTSVEHVVDLLAWALSLDPSRSDALELLFEVARDAGDDLVALDAFERTCRLVDGPDAAGLLVELAQRAGETSEGAARALWAFGELGRVAPALALDATSLAHLEERAHVSTEAIARAEDELRALDQGALRVNKRRLGSLLRTRPERRREAIALYREILEQDEADESAATTLERLAWTSGDDATLLAHLGARAASAGTDDEKKRALLRIARIGFRLGRPADVIDACSRVLDLAPTDAEALARLEHAAVHTRSGEDMRRALERRLVAEKAPRERARVLTLLALLAEREGKILDALEHARSALALDPRAARAARLRARHVASLTHEEGVEVLVALRTCEGDSIPSLAALTELAASTNARGVRDDAVDAWCALSPLDPSPALRRLLWCIAGDDPDRLRSAIDHAVDAHGVDVGLIARALSRLSELSSADAATVVALRAVDHLGERSLDLVRVALGLAEESGRADHVVAALERLVVAQEKPDRRATLLRLAEIHAAEGSLAREARTLLRVVAIDPRDRDVLVRLSQIYAETGETERLLAVLALRLDAATDLEERHSCLATTISVALDRGGDFERAVSSILGLFEESDDPIDTARRIGAACANSVRPDDAVSAMCKAAARLDAAPAAALYEEAARLAEGVANDKRRALDVVMDGLEQCPASTRLLVAFERLALELGDVHAARGTYRSLEDRAMGKHGRRGLLYREARWLERAGDTATALDAYTEAFSLAPAAGVVFGSIERLADQLSSHEPLARACMLLGERLPHPDARLSMWKRAATVYEKNLDRPDTAFDTLLDAWRTTGDRETYVELRRVANAIAARDAARGKEARDRVVSILRERAEQSWDDEDRADKLLEIAELLAMDGGEWDEAVALVTEAMTLAGSEMIEPASRARMMCRAARWLSTSDGTRELAKTLARDALRIAPDDDLARELAPALGLALGAPVSVSAPVPVPVAEPVAAPEPAPEPEPTSEPEPASEPESASVPEPVSEPASASEPASEPESASVPEPVPASASVPASVSEPPPSALSAPNAAPASEPAPVSAAVSKVGSGPPLATVDSLGGFRPSLVDPHEITLRAAMARGDDDAAEELVTRLLADRTRGRESLDVLLWLLRRDPSRVDLLRTLHGAAARLDAPAVVASTAEILSLFDPKIEVVTESTSLLPFLEGGRTAITDASVTPFFEVLRLLWEGAQPLFRKSARAAGVAGLTPLSTLSPTLLARTFDVVRTALDPGELSLYVRRTSGRSIVIARTSPPSIIAEEGAADEHLLFRLARLAELARPRHLLAATLTPSEGEEMVDAVNAAFAPVHLSPSVDRKSMTLAAGLWNTVPARTQSEIRLTLERAGSLPPFATLRAVALEMGARIGLLVTGSLRTSVEALVMDDEELAELTVTSESLFASAVKRSPVLRALVGLALDDHYLAARARSLKARSSR